MKTLNKVNALAREHKTIKTPNGYYVITLYDRDYKDSTLTNKSIVEISLFKHIRNGEPRIVFSFEAYFTAYPKGYRYFWDTYEKMKRRLNNEEPVKTKF